MWCRANVTKGWVDASMRRLDTNLAGSSLHLLSRDLGSSTTSSDRLGLDGLALLSLGLLVLLALGNGLLAGCSSHFGLLVSAGVDDIERGTDNSALVLDSLARALLGHFLSDTLLMKTSVHGGPCNLAWVLALQEQRLVLGANKSEDLVVTSNVKTTLSTVVPIPSLKVSLPVRLHDMMTLLVPVPKLLRAEMLLMVDAFFAGLWHVSIE